MLRIAAFAAFAALIGLGAVPAQAQTPDSTQATPYTVLVSSVSPEDANTSRVRFNEGYALLGQNDYAGALAKFDEGLALDPTNNRNAYGRALALAQLGREDDAVAAFRQAITLSETAGDAETLGAARRAHGTITYNRAIGQALELLQANPLPQPTAEQALPLLMEAEEALPHLAEGTAQHANQIPYQLARVHNVLGNYDEAVRYGERAVEANAGQEDMSGYYIELGLAHKGAGNVEAARAAFEQARNGAWSGWAEHYLRELDAAGSAGGSQEGVQQN